MDAGGQDVAGSGAHVAHIQMCFHRHRRQDRRYRSIRHAAAAILRHRFVISSSAATANLFLFIIVIITIFGISIFCSIIINADAILCFTIAIIKFTYISIAAISVESASERSRLLCVSQWQQLPRRMERLSASWYGLNAICQRFVLQWKLVCGPKTRERRFYGCFRRPIRQAWLHLEGGRRVRRRLEE